MKATYDILTQFRVIQLSSAEVRTLEQASGILRLLRETVSPDADETADSDLGRADANLWQILHDIDRGRYIP